MTQYEIYTFFLCLIVFVALTALFSYLIAYLIKQMLRLIECGGVDKEILQEYQDSFKKKPARVFDVISIAISGVVCTALFLVFVFAFCLHMTETTYESGLPSLKVVQSDSMAVKHSQNAYLFADGLDDQLQTFDIVLTSPLPPENELQLYDIVVYERDGEQIIHRIVKIEEPNQNHPDRRYFTTQGDASQYTDIYPVTYDMMRAVYSDVRVPLLGSFVMFMQSPAGWLCILLIVFAWIAVPVVESKLKKAKLSRLVILRQGHPLPEKQRMPRLRTHPLTVTHCRWMLRVQKDKPQVSLDTWRTEELFQRRQSGRRGEKR